MPFKCFVNGCKSGSAKTCSENKKLGIRNASLFGAPLDPVLFQLWKEKIPQVMRPFKADDRICELHFTDDCIQWYTTVPGPTGIEYRKRRFPTLKKGAVPTIFPEYIVSTPSIEEYYF